MRHKRNMKENLVHCCVCGTTLGTTSCDGKPMPEHEVLCRECNTLLIISVDANGHRVVRQHS